MCFSKPKVDTSYQDFSIDEAKRARAEEEARQLRIEEGMKQIAAIFEGGEYAAPLSAPEAVKVTQIANPDYVAAVPSQPGTEGWGGAPAQGDRYLPSVPGAEIGSWAVPEITERGEVQTYEGMQPVLDQRRSAMEGFYLPQLDKQFGDAQDELVYALARSGQLTSSTAGNKQGDLSELFALNRTSLENDIASDIASTQTQMNQQRQSLEAALRASGDQTGAANSALQSAVTFRNDAPTLSPLGNVFYGLSEGIGSLQTGYENGRIQSLATPNPLSNGTGRVVR